MRFLTACILLSVATNSPAIAQNAGILYHGCKAISDGNSSTFGDKAFDMGVCAGTISAAAGYLAKVHNGFYVTWFPNITYPIKDAAKIDSYIANGVMIGPNVCFPDELNIKILAEVVKKYGRQNPSKLTDDTFKFAVNALSSAYLCGPNRMK